MHKKIGYLSRYLSIVLACLIIFSALIFGFANYLFTQAYNQSEKKKLSSTLTAGIRLLDAYSTGWIGAKKLWEEVNPVLNAGDSFLMLLDTRNNIIAYTDEAVPYFVRMDLESVIQQVKDSIASPVFDVSMENSTALVTGTSSLSGTVIAGIRRTGSSSIVASFRLRLLIFIICAFLLLLALVLCAKHFIEKPTKILSDASMRLLDGETIEVSENLPGEMQEIANAFNHASRKISRTFQDLKYEKETMRLILESLNEGILAIDANGKLLHENSAALRLLDGSASSATATVHEELRRCIQEKGGEKQAYAGKVNVKGRILLYLISALPFSPGQPEGAVALIRDITEQEHLEKTRHDYVANISHELRTPLASIRGIAEGLRDGMVSEQADFQRCLNIIVDESTRLSRLVNDLLELSGLQSNPAAFETEKVDAVELILDLHDRNLSLFTEAGIAFAYDLKKNDDGEIQPLPVIISNEDRLAEVLTIFIDNARKYTQRGGSVMIGAAQVETGIRFFVKDNGIGMDEETQRLAFDRFHQAEKSHSDQGSGLGLAIAKEIMQKMKVDINLVSEPGKGSEFSFVIPVQKAEEKS